MAMRDAAPLLALLGHELRAPAGVIGGYLTLLDKPTEQLSPEQQAAISGARRAQQRLVEVLDDTSQLVTAWRAETVAAAELNLTALIDEVRAVAKSRDLALTVAAPREAAVTACASQAAVVDALVSVAAAVAREHGVGVEMTVHLAQGHDRDGSSADVVAAPSVTWQIRAEGAGAGTHATTTERESFNLWRPGLGLRLVVAATTLVNAGARLNEVLVEGQRVGVDVTFGAGPSPGRTPPA